MTRNVITWKQSIQISPLKIWNGAEIKKSNTSTIKLINHIKCPQEVHLWFLHTLYVVKQTSLVYCDLLHTHYRLRLLQFWRAERKTLIPKYHDGNRGQNVNHLGLRTGKIVKLLTSILSSFAQQTRASYRLFCLCLITIAQYTNRVKLYIKRYFWHKEPHIQDQYSAT